MLKYSENSEVVGNITSEVPEYLMLNCVAGISVQVDELTSDAFGNVTLMDI